MDYHLEHDLKLIIAPPEKTLYTWAIGEFDRSGKQLGPDKICWEWTAYFQATEFTVSESLRIAPRDLRGQTLESAEVTNRSQIKAKLKPGNPRDDEFGYSTPTYRMFGTDRVITVFELDISPAAADEPETCTAWGGVSYTSEVDFRDDTQPDAITFYLRVHQSRFDRYVWNIAQGVGEELLLAVGHVDGFYSEWSPSISTREIKVLTKGSEQKVQMPELIGFEMPRLGDIGHAEFGLSSRRVVRRREANASSEPQYDEAHPEGSGSVDDRRSAFRWPGRR